MGRERNWPEAEIAREVEALVRAGSVESGPFSDALHLAYAAAAAGAPADAVAETVRGLDPGYVAQGFVSLRAAEIEMHNRRVRRDRRG